MASSFATFENLLSQLTACFAYATANLAARLLTNAATFKVVKCLMEGLRLVLNQSLCWEWIHLLYFKKRSEQVSGSAPFFSPVRWRCFISLRLVGFPVLPALCSEQTCLRGYILHYNYPASLPGFLCCQVSEEKRRLKRAEMIIFNSDENWHGGWGLFPFPRFHLLTFGGSLKSHATTSPSSTTGRREPVASFPCVCVIRTFHPGPSAQESSFPPCSF